MPLTALVVQLKSRVVFALLLAFVVFSHLLQPNSLLKSRFSLLEELGFTQSNHPCTQMSSKKPAGPPQNGGNKTAEVQQQVDEVVGIMQTNIEKVIARGEKLDSLQTKTDDLQQGAMQFKKGATKVRKQMWWKDMKLKMIIVGIILVIIAVIILIVYTTSK